MGCQPADPIQRVREIGPVTFAATDYITDMGIVRVNWLEPPGDIP
jgi:hypothetical protein